MRAISLILLLTSLAWAQEPSLELRLSMAESQLAAAKLSAETATVRRVEAEKELAAQRAETERIASAAAGLAKALAEKQSALEKQQVTIEARDHTITILIAENKRIRGWRASLLRVLKLR